MLSWCRRWARSISTASLLSLVALMLWSSAPHPEDCHESECGIVALHDPSGHSVGRPQPPGDPDIHCVLCHWTRSVRQTPQTSPLPAPVAEADVRVACDVLLPPSHSALAQPSLRAPPAASLLA